ncbi:sulfatase-like hydrolase/transferase [Coraliomargarita sp. W4R53]
MASRPNILLLMPDQMRGDCLSANGHSVVRTPVIDRLAEGGSLFRRAYSTVPSCIPARHAFLTGCFPQTTGNVGFEAMPIDHLTLPAFMQKNGYETALVGRNMHQSIGDEELGFSYVRSGSTYVNDDDYDVWLKHSEAGARGIGDLIESEGLTCNHWPSQPWPLDDELHPTNWTVEESKQLLSHRKSTAPLFLVSSFYAPHPPLFPPKKHFESISRRELPQAPLGGWVKERDLNETGNGEGNRIYLKGERLRRAQCGYYGLIEHLDAAIESLIEDFRQKSEAAGREWCIIFTSDHGEMLGDHAYFRKCEPYEGATNIPFIITGSLGFDWSSGLTHDVPVCLEDIFSTLISISGDVTGHGVDGQDLTGFLRGDGAADARILHLEHSACYEDGQAFHALTDGRMKYIWRPSSGEEQLFDLQNDHCELLDLTGSSEHAALVVRWRDILIGRLLNRPEGFVKNGSLVAGVCYDAVMTVP